MKICIYAQGRSGSTSLYKLISNHLNDLYLKYDEPFNSFSNKKMGLDGDTITNKLFNSENVIIKTLHYNTINGVTEFEMPEFLSKKFDKIIFLIRKDTIAQSESFLYRLNSNPYDWHTPEVYDLNIITKEELDNRNNEYTLSNNFLINYCNLNGIPIYTYEDIFVEKNIEIVKQIFNYLEIDLDYTLYNEWIINSSKKVRL